MSFALRVVIDQSLIGSGVAKVSSLRIEIVKKSDDMKRFVLLPCSCVVERTVSWFGRNRRLAKDWKTSPRPSKLLSCSLRSKSQSDDSRGSCLLSQALTYGQGVFHGAFAADAELIWLQALTATYPAFGKSGS